MKDELVPCCASLRQARAGRRPAPLVCAVVAALSLQAFAQPAATLPGTAPLAWPEADLSSRLMDGAHAFIERKIGEARGERGRYWRPDFSSPDAYAKSLEPNRARLREIIGAVDPRLPPQMERHGDDANPALVADAETYRVWQVRWPVLEGVWGAGLLVEPKGAVRARAVIVPDAGQSPEELLAGEVRRLAASGIELVVPVTVSRAKLPAADAPMRSSDQTYREWIYRQAFHMGRHVIGYEVQTVLAAVDWFARDRDRPRSQHAAAAGDGRGPRQKIGVAGYGEGALVALHAAAIDPRIDGALVSGYFASREEAWGEPIYRNVWSRVREFGDAEIAQLITGPELLVEYSPIAVVQGHKGELHPPTWTDVQAEIERIRSPRCHVALFGGPETVGPYSTRAVDYFASTLGVGLSPGTGEPPRDQRKSFDPAARHERYFRELEGHVQLLVRRADFVREQNFLLKVMPELAGGRWSTERRHPTHSPEKFVAGAREFRRRFWEEAMGRFDDPLMPFNARTRKVAETDKWIAYDVVLDVFPELFAWGVLVVPKDLKPGERRPVVVCQHGRNGVPRDTVDGNKTAYNNFAGVLAERGFITFAPHNLYRGEDRYRWLSRKANTLGRTLFSFILAQHDQITRWLDTLPFVDGSRIAFYGLSYGGETAVRVPPILEKYALSICSGDFNQWTRKVASTDQPFTFMRTIEWEMPYWNLGQTFDYAEMAYLMVPRPFMVERGHHDRVGRDSWVAHEYAKVRWLYAQLGLADKTEIEFFQGGHSINGEGTFRFLEKHLGWPGK